MVPGAVVVWAFALTFYRLCCCGCGCGCSCSCGNGPLDSLVASAFYASAPLPDATYNKPREHKAYPAAAFQQASIYHSELLRKCMALSSTVPDPPTRCCQTAMDHSLNTCQVGCEVGRFHWTSWISEKGPGSGCCCVLFARFRSHGGS